MITCAWCKRPVESCQCEPEPTALPGEPSIDEIQRDLQTLSDSLGIAHDSHSLIDHVIERLVTLDAALASERERAEKAERDSADLLAANLRQVEWIQDLNADIVRLQEELKQADERALQSAKRATLAESRAEGVRGILSECRERMADLMQAAKGGTPLQRETLAKLDAQIRALSAAGRDDK